MLFVQGGEANRVETDFAHKINFFSITFEPNLLIFGMPSCRWWVNFVLKDEPNRLPWKAVRAPWSWTLEFSVCNLLIDLVTRGKGFEAWTFGWKVHSPRPNIRPYFCFENQKFRIFCFFDVPHLSRGSVWHITANDFSW